MTLIDSDTVCQRNFFRIECKQVRFWEKVGTPPPHHLRANAVLRRDFQARLHGTQSAYMDEFAKELRVSEPRIEGERRGWERLPIAIPMFIRGTDTRGRKFLEFANALNISGGGALVATKLYLPKHTRVTLEIPVQAFEDTGQLPRSVHILPARIVRLEQAEQYHIWGVKFARPITRVHRLP